MKTSSQLIFLGIVFGLLPKLFAQQTFPSNGVSDNRPNQYALINATIHPEPGKSFANGILLIQKGKIKEIGVGFDVPKGYVVVDMQGKHLFPGLIDAYSHYGMPDVKKPKYFSYYDTQFDSQKEGPYAANQAVKPEVSAAALFKPNPKKAKELRELGFTTAWVHHRDGIARGTGALVSLGLESEHEEILAAKVSRHFSFDKGSSAQSYPISLMGSVALLRQTYLDAEWYAKGGSKEETNLSLKAFAETQNLPGVFEARDVYDALRGDKVGDEFGQQFIIKGNGDEYQKLNWVKNTGASFIIPLDLPQPLDLSDPLDNNLTVLSDMKHWDWAASNPVLLDSMDIEFAISSEGVSQGDFYKNLRKVINRGLSREKALAAMTTIPAKMLGMEEQLGVLKRGAIANLFITDKDLFEKDVKRLETWVNGKRYVNQNYKNESLRIRNTYTLLIDGISDTYLIKHQEKGGKVSSELYKSDSLKVKAKIKFEDSYVIINAPLADSIKVSRLSGFEREKGVITGTGVHPDGNTFRWSARENNKENTLLQKKRKSTLGDRPLTPMRYPFLGYGNLQVPEQEDVLIKNAIVWTNEEDGILKNAQVWVKGGKIAGVGNSLVVPSDIRVIDAKGKHLTTGIIDEHSHIALFSINEVQTVSSHVRQADVINGDDINIYRQLAGGVTTSQLLHGSADCIGGQSAIVKLKWGRSPQEMLIPGADRFIKFALGENVKRGNAPNYPNRYPVTRMGVEQVYYDAFSQAKEYKKKWLAYESLSDKVGVMPLRRELSKEALVDIMDKKLFITCHSYVQSEINMLMHVADSMGFKVNTFTHILEGYKVADKMKEHGVYGSTFSDWWAYKMEVKEAIPYNAALMTKAGVVTAINSDDAEMARRLNQEAAKTILYGGLSQEEAWKTITLNPAKMLHLDNRIGSIKVGKDADLVLWNTNPLSVYAVPEFTMIEGAKYFDHSDYKEKSIELKNERNILIQAMLDSKEKKKKIYQSKPAGVGLKLHCESIVEYGGMDLEAFENQYVKKQANK